MRPPSSIVGVSGPLRPPSSQTADGVGPVCHMFAAHMRGVLGPGIPAGMKTVPSSACTLSGAVSANGAEMREDISSGRLTLRWAITQ
ncbi:hypothetical protein [Streptomyces sp. NPDC048155]|uniref:hypothetical protein n=1 Tax=Streptomyces sp. NPDC048155 TaxID=3154818 RepID=UPI00341153EE